MTTTLTSVLKRMCWSNMQIILYKKYSQWWGQLIKYVINQGKGGFPKDYFTNKPYFVKVMTKGGGGSKIP